MFSIALPSFLSTSKQVVSHTPILISLQKMVSIAIPFSQTVWLQMKVSTHHVSVKRVLVSCTFLQCLDSMYRTISSGIHMSQVLPAKRVNGSTVLGSVEQPISPRTLVLQLTSLRLDLF